MTESDNSKGSLKTKLRILSCSKCSGTVRVAEPCTVCNGEGRLGINEKGEVVKLPPLKFANDYSFFNGFGDIR